MRRFPLAILAVALAGCSLLDVAPPTVSSTANPADLAKQMSATIDGVAWFAQFVAIQQADSTIQFTGVLNPGQSSERTIVLQFRKGRTGTQSFGNDGGTYARVAVGNSTIQSWITRAGGPTGEINVNVISTNHYTGTFSFDAAGSFADLTPAVRKVTSGIFDITF
jgi:hypothetical protein